MEEPEPINKKIKEKYELNDKEGKNYDINISYDEKNIYFELFFSTEILKEKYTLDLDLNTLRKSCKTFNLLENCKEVFNFIKDLLKSKKIYIKNENGSIYFIMIVPFLLKEEEIKFCLKKQVNSQEDIINSLLHTVRELKNEIQEHKKEYIKLKNENDEIIKRLNSLEKWKNVIE